MRDRRRTLHTPLLWQMQLAQLRGSKNEKNM